jgi:hypothetical protein
LKKHYLTLSQIRKELRDLVKACEDSCDTMHGVLNPRQLEAVKFAAERLKLTSTCGLCGKILRN